MASVNLIRALEENLWDFWKVFGRTDKGTLAETPEQLWFETELDVLPYNGVLRFRETEDIDAKIDAHFEHFKKIGKPFYWFIHPTMEPKDLEIRLPARGFESVDSLTGMTAQLDQLPDLGPLAAGVEIREVVDDTEVDSLIDFLMWRWEVPSEHKSFYEEIMRRNKFGQPDQLDRVWCAWKDGAPVAKAVTHETDGVIGLYGVATRPEARGLGLGRAICLQALQETDAGRGLLGVLHSSPMAVGLYEKMGFETICDFKVFATAGSFHV